ACCEPDRLVIFARAVSTENEAIRVVALRDATPEMADMRTMVLVGSSLTRMVDRGAGRVPWVYTPRSVAGGTSDSGSAAP
ncbi:MAG: hypothetical protein ACPG7W_00905, partial [Paracoccaceae bacterium]